MTNVDITNPQGSFAYENWKAFLAGAPPADALEYPVYGDAHITGELRAELGPHQILKCIAEPNADPTRPLLVLRVEYHVRWSYRDMSSTDDRQYHGGTVQDELTALLSLCLGTRLKAGGANRWFQRDRDPRGRPWSFREAGRADPIPLAHRGLGTILPHASDDKRLDAALHLARFVHLTPEGSIALVRAARLYQDGIWLAESDPALSWLLLVAAVESAAGYWHTVKDSPRTRLKWAYPELAALLEKVGGGEHADKVAELLADRLGVGKKFVEFCLNFLPTPTRARPDQHLHIPWDVRFLRAALRCIYNYRSKALHGGTPFPAPMCWPPRLCGHPVAEKLPGRAAGGDGGVWRSKDIPMLLHVFEHISRGVLLGWWDDLLTKGREPGLPGTDV